MAAKVVAFLNDLKTDSSRLAGRIQESILAARKIQFAAGSPPKITVAVLGDSGAGKSSLLNALLDAEILPSSSTEVCTAGITRVRSEDIDCNRISVIFSKRSEWNDEIHKIANDIQGALSEVSAASEDSERSEIRNISGAVSRLDQERLKAVYGRDSATRFFETGDTAELVEPAAIAEALDEGERVLTFSDSWSQVKSELKTLLTDKAEEGVYGQLWPIVQDVLIEGRFEGLPSELELVDLPGVNDPNSAREKKTLNYLENARFLLVAYTSIRPPTKEVSQVLRSRQLAKKLILSGREDSITFVATKSDDFDEDDEIFDNIADMSTEAKAKYRVIQVEKALNNSLPKIAEDVSSESESPEEEEILLSALNGSRKFVTSAKSYRKLRAIESGKKTVPPPFTSPKDTGIPALRMHLAYLAQVAGPYTQARRFRSELIDAVGSVQAMANQELAQASLGTKENREQLARVVERISHLSNALIQNLSNVSTTESECLQEATSKVISTTQLKIEDAIQFSRRYRQEVSSLHWSTLRAACSRGGRYSSSTAGLIDLQNLVVQPIVERLFGAWKQIFTVEFNAAVDSVKREIETWLLNYAESVKEILSQSENESIPRIINELITSARNLSDQLMATTVLRIDEGLQKEQEALLSVARKSVKNNMQPAIINAGSIRGKGSAARMREMLTESAAIAFSDSYAEAVSEAIGVLHVTTRFLVDAMDSVAQGSIKQIREIERLVTPQEHALDVDNENAISFLIHEIEAFLESLRTPEGRDYEETETPSPQADASKPLRIEGSYILVDGSNLATSRVPGSSDRKGSLKKLLSARDALIAKFPDRKVKIFVDATFRHIVADEEKAEIDELLSSDEIMQPGPRTQGRADKVILSFAESCDSLIVSNDAYRQWELEFPIVNEPGKILNAVYDQDLGWNFSIRG
jgi:GTPase SAR1 family protein